MTARDGAPTAPRLLTAVARPLLGRWLGLEVDGVEHVPATGGVIVAANHVSHADVLALGAACPRSLTFLGSAHLAAAPVSGPLLRRLGLVVVRRGAADVGVLERCVEVLDAGGALVVFPEGGRSRDRRVHRPRSGVARIAALAGCPVVPAGLAGTAAYWPPEGRPRLRARTGVSVSFGPPIDPPPPSPRERRRFNDRLHRALVDLSGCPAADELLRR